jgi:hypothetical protein
MDPVSRAASDERALVNAKLAETLNINLSKSKESLLGGFEYRLSASSQSLDEDGLAENSSLSNEGDNGSRIDQPPDFPTSSAVDVQKNLMLSVQLLRQQVLRLCKCTSVWLRVRVLLPAYMCVLVTAGQQ